LYLWEKNGIAFLGRDDLLDVYGDSKTFGKKMEEISFATRKLFYSLKHSKKPTTLNEKNSKNGLTTQILIRMPRLKLFEIFMMLSI
jgi:geranylgeranyl pyrophosphate synthase